MNEQHITEQKSDSSWLQFISKAYVQLLEEENTRELGKLLATANEHMQADWINKNTCLEVMLREDNDPNGTGYDLISSSGLRIQSKFRGGNSLFIEQTRRNSAKNKGAASRTGHVVPALGECDVYIFTIPNGNYENPDECQVLVIPEEVLEDPNNPGFLRPRVLMKHRRAYEGRAEEILNNLEREINEKRVFSRG